MRKKSIFRRRWFLIFFGGGFICCVIAVVVAWVITEKYRDRAAEYDLDLVDDVQLPNYIFDRESNELGRIFNENRDPVNVEDVPQLFIDTLIAAEDARFFSHNGYDLKGITRVALQEFQGGSVSGGASTLTQQLARNAFYLKDERERRKESSYERKLVEIFLAMEIEERYTKQDILEFYLNRVNFGSGYYGIRSASLGFFGKEPKDLELHECAALVGSIRNPAHYNPSSMNKKPDGTRERGYQNKMVKDRVLVRMATEGMISEEERDEYKKRKLVLNPTPIQRGTSHFHDRVDSTFNKTLDDLGISESDRSGGGYKIFTTIDGDVQREMEGNLKRKLTEIEQMDSYEHPKYADYERTEDSKPEYLQGAGIAINNENGAVIAYVGGRDFVHSQYDFADSGRKPLGTAFFPFIYASALENGMNGATQLIDEALDNRQVMIGGVEGILGEWGNEVMDPTYEGLIPMRRALAASKIAATVRLGRGLGLETVWETAVKFGLRKPEGRLLTRTLLGSESGSIKELVKSYSAFPHQGKELEKLVWIERIEDETGNVVYQWDQKEDVKRKQVISSSSAFLVHTMLEDALKTGSGSDVFEQSNMVDFNGGGKTGTTSDFSNHWFVGYNGRVTCALWTGFFDGARKQIYQNSFSKDTVMPVWIDTMKVAEIKLGDELIEQPEDIVKLRICRDSGKVCSKSCEEPVHNIVSGRSEYVSTGVEEYFHESQRPKGTCHVHGASLRDFHADFMNSGPGLSALALLNTTPIKPKEATLIGDDPYNSLVVKIKEVKKRSVNHAGRGLGAMDLDFLEKENDASSMYLTKPPRMEISD